MISSLIRNRVALRLCNRSAFTLIEMLVAITIMLVVFSMTAGVVSLAINTERIPSTVRTVQAAIMGARDRALRAGKASPDQQLRRGIRFVLNSTLPQSIGSLVYIGSQDDWEGGGEDARPPSWVSVTHSTKGISFNPGLPSDLPDLTGSRIKILDPGGNWYRVQDATATLLTRDYAGDPMDPNKNYGYRIELPPTILPNEQPLQLDTNVAINLDISADHEVIPSSWYNRSGDGTLSPVDNPFVYTSYNQSAMQIEFKPNGGVYGPLAANGPIYLYLCTTDDLLAERVSPPDRRSLPKGRDPADPKRGEAVILKITPQTGQIQTFPVDPTDQYRNSTLQKYSSLADYSGPPDATPDGLADNPFRFAQQ